MPIGSGITIARFSNGRLKPDQGGAVQFRCFEEKTEPTKERRPRKRMLVAESGDSTYVGQSDAITAPSQQCKYLVGVVDKASGKMTVHDAKLFTMLPHRDEESDDDEKEKIGYMQKIDKLTAAFGSTKKRRAMDARHKNKLSAERLNEAVDTAVGATLVRSDVDSLLKVQETSSAASETIPPYNINGTTAAEVYPLSGIISDDLMEALRVSAQVFVDSNSAIVTEWQKSQKYPVTVLRQVRVLPLKEAPRLRKACCLLYLSYLMHMYKLRVPDLKKKDLFPDMDVPADVEKSLLNRFTLRVENSRQRTMPSRLKDKIVCYILTLCLILEEFALEFTTLCEDLQITRPKLIGFLRGLGCKINQQTRAGIRSDVATLPVPLTFPDLTKRKKASRNK